ncbi:MAG: hypothetical protein LBQ18_02720 [Campylobacteraceae bacterium]|jgi:hypothetical protein|nr:hypothetical protein [Campylobacteraceae bacterium]
MRAFFIVIFLGILSYGGDMKLFSTDITEKLNTKDDNGQYINDYFDVGYLSSFVLEYGDRFDGKIMRNSGDNIHYKFGKFHAYIELDEPNSTWRRDRNYSPDYSAVRIEAEGFSYRIKYKDTVSPTKTAYIQTIIHLISDGKALSHQEIEELFLNIHLKEIKNEMRRMRDIKYVNKEILIDITDKINAEYFNKIVALLQKRGEKIMDGSLYGNIFCLMAGGKIKTCLLRVPMIEQTPYLIEVDIRELKGFKLVGYDDGKVYLRGFIGERKMYEEYLKQEKTIHEILNRAVNLFLQTIDKDIKSNSK